MFDDRLPRSARARQDVDHKAKYLCSWQKGGGTTASTEFKPPANTQPGWDQYVQNALGLSGMPYQSSGVPSVAPWNAWDQFAAQGIYDRAANGAPDINAARGAITSIAGGNQQNPWQGFLAGTASGGNQNPFMAGMADMAGGKSNPYMINPDEMIKATAADMTTAAQRGPMAQTDALANRTGAYGGSDWNLQQSSNAGELARGVGSMSAQARLAAAQQNANTWQQQQQNQLAALGLGGNTFSTGLGQQIGAATAGGQMFNSDIGNILSAAGLSVPTSNTDWEAFNQVAGQGAKMGAYQQALLNAGNDEFSRQQMWPQTLNELLGGALSRASGGQSGGSQSTTGPGSNTFWNLAGLGTTLYGLTRNP